MTRQTFQMITVGALALGLAFSLAGFVGFPGTDASPATKPEWTPDLKSLDMSRDPITPGKSFPQTLARPLFSPTRKPPEARPPEPVAQQTLQPAHMPQPVQVTSPDTLILKGIFIDDERRLALIQTPAAPHGLWLATGATVEGWTVSRIDKQSIAIETTGQAASLTLYVDNSAN